VKPSFFDWIKFMVATALAGGMLYIHAYVKDLPVMLMGAPYLLMGVDLSKLPTLWGGKK
jgi:hypothetical protein